jgi:glycosyltransferase involved in cell wall biosynthesis
VHIAFVVQRYGLEVSGGAELHCRQVVERLGSETEFDAEVLTTCAQDYVTWENVYSPGLDTVNGVPVQRFPTTCVREESFGDRSARLFGRPHEFHDEMDWLHAQGPVVPDLLHYLAKHHLDYDAFVFFTYIYYPTALGLRLVTDRALLVPTAHDEPPIYLDVYKALFQSPRAFLYNTVEERRFLEDLFGIAYIPGEVVGVGIDVPKQLKSEAFRRKYDLCTPYVIYLGRVSRSKNCEELFDYFVRYKNCHSTSLTLVLAGKVEIPLPKRSDIRALGFVSDEDKFNALAGAEIMLLSSKLESLSMAFLESLGCGTPVLCNGTSAVLRGHCHRSNAALYYLNYPEFEASLEVMLKEDRLRYILGRNGTTYVQERYTWSRVLQKYERLLRYVVHTRWW